jgi:hypothetical protein
MQPSAFLGARSSAQSVCTAQKRTSFVIFRQDILARIVTGEVTLAFRRWRRAPPVSGATLKTAAGVVAIEEVQVVTEGDISDADARRSGEASAAALVRSLPADGSLIRMRVRYVGEDPRIALRARRISGQGEADVIVAQLRGIDRRAAKPWTAAVLDAIGAQPGVVSSKLAAQFGLDTLTFKRRVRVLKELGLTESLEVGYRLAPRGRDALNAMRSG